MPGHAITSPDARLIPAMGDCRHNTSWTVKGLAPGTHWWSVQAVDTGLMVGPWAAEEQVMVPWRKAEMLRASSSFSPHPSEKGLPSFGA